jgi:hypothetical protein
MFKDIQDQDRVKASEGAPFMFIDLGVDQPSCKGIPVKNGPSNSSHHPDGPEFLLNSHPNLLFNSENSDMPTFPSLSI